MTAPKQPKTAGRSTVTVSAKAWREFERMFIAESQRCRQRGAYIGRLEAAARDALAGKSAALRRVLREGRDVP